MQESDVRVKEGHFLRFNGPVNNIHEAPAIGNGDLGALVQVFQDEFRLHLGKNDIWDARFDHVAKDWVVTQGDLIRMSRDYGFRLEGENYRGRPVFDRRPPRGLRYVDHGPGRGKHIFPGLKVAGLIRVFHSGSCASRIQTTLDLRSGIVTAEFGIEFGWHGSGLLRIEAFVDRLANVVRLRLRQEKIPLDIRLCVEKEPDAGGQGIPLPGVRRFDDWHGAVSQIIPAGYDVPEFQWHLAAAFPRPAPGREARPIEAHLCPHRLWQACRLAPDQSLELAVGVATSRENAKRASNTSGRTVSPAFQRATGAGSLARARRLAGEATAGAYDRARAAHVRAWTKFWDRSGIELEDKELEKTWYRNLFALACVISSKAMAPMGCGNVTISEPRQNAVHSGYTVNMNIQKMFLASLPTNHPDWNDCYANWLDGMRPTFRYFAKLIFGLPGIYSPHWLFPFLPPERQINSNQCGRALGMTGWHGQPLWWRWEYFRDKAFLRQRAYPYFKGAACFYCYVKLVIDS